MSTGSEQQRLEIVVTGQQAIALLAKNLSRLTNEQNRNIKATKGFLVSWQSVGRIIVGSLVSRGIGLLVRSIREGIENVSEFIIRVGEIRTISQHSQLATEQWVGSLRALSDEFARPILDVAEGAYQALSNQIAEGAETARFMDEALRLSIITVSTTAEAVQLLTGVLNSYGLGAEHAREVSDSLFKTIELGRLRAQNIANSIGNVTMAASELGITYQEVETALTVLTIKGVQASRSMTYLRNVFLKLIRPTNRMRELFEEWGVQSGQSAIETFGFVGVLRKLAEEAEKSHDPLDEIGEIFGRIRAIVGATGLVSAFDRFEANLKEIKEGAEAAANAEEEMRQAIAVSLRKELNELKNFFTIDIGYEAVKSIHKANEAIGGLTNAIKVTLPYIDGMVTALLLVGGSYVIGGIISLIRHLTLLRAAQLGVVAAMYIVFEVAQLIYNEQAKKTKKLIEFALAEKNIYQQIANEKLNTALQNIAKETTAVLDGLRTQEQEYKRVLAEVTAGYNFLNKVREGQISNSELLFEIEKKLAKKEHEKATITARYFKERLIDYQIMLDQGRLDEKQKAAAIKQLIDLTEELRDYEDVLFKVDGLNKKGRFVNPGLMFIGQEGYLKPDKYADLQLKKIKSLIQEGAEATKEYGDLRRHNFDLLLQEMKGNLRLSEAIDILTQRRKKLGDTEEEAATAASEANKKLADAYNEIKASLPSTAYLAMQNALIRSSEHTKQQKEELNALQIAVFNANKEISSAIQLLQGLSPAIYPTEYIEERFKGILENLKGINRESPLPQINEFAAAARAAIDVYAEEREALLAARETTKATDISIGRLNMLLEQAKQIHVENLHNAGNEQNAMQSLENARRLLYDIELNAIELYRGEAIFRERAADAAERELKARQAMPSDKGGNKWTGGYMTRFAGGGGVGSDNIHALLSAGEFVMNKNAARQYLPQLVAMNSGAARFDSGGDVVNNNIGDINVTVQGGDTSERTVRQIAGSLRRELKRNTVRLN